MTNFPFPGILPEHPRKIYEPAGRCIYCDSTDDLRSEHIIPYGFGGNWKIPEASCRECEKITSAFEGTCLRTIFGPLRMTYGVQSRRKKSRPDQLPLKVKFSAEEDWQDFMVDRGECPYLILMPQWLMPDDLSGYSSIGQSGTAAKTFWIRGSPSELRREDHYESLCKKYGFHSIMPTGQVTTEEFSLLLAKIAHAFSTAEIAADLFQPYLKAMIRNRDTLYRPQWIGSLSYHEKPSNELHEVSFDQHTCDRLDLVSVRTRLMAVLGTPTYFVVAGRRY